MPLNTVYIETYGCQMNVYDTELVKTILKDASFTIVEKAETADIVMLNTCSVRDNANRKVYNRIHTVKQSRPDNKPVKIGILGCMATNFRQALLDDPKLGIDFIAGPDSYKQLPHLIHELQEDKKKSFDVTLSEFETYEDVYPTREDGVNAWIAVMRGCNNYCTFCVVPFTRGRERSRSPYSIVDEAKRLVDNGFSQVTLLGQNVNSYRFIDGHDETDFADLIEQVSDVPGIKRIRYTSPHPKDYPMKLLRVMAERENVCKQLHMPLQAGNSRVLKKMNRTYTQEEFLTLVDNVRSEIPDIAISTDIIVGFPTETDAEFLDTYNVMKSVEFDSAFIYKYSERPGTLAARRIPDDVPEAIKTERIVKLNELQTGISLKKNNEHIGQEHVVLIEELTSKKNDAYSVARNDQNKLVLVERSNFNVGDYVPVSILDASPHNLKGCPI